MFIFHLNMELLTQFPDSNDETYFYLFETDITIELLDYLSTTSYLITFSDILLGFKPATYKQIIVQPLQDQYI